MYKCCDGSKNSGSAQCGCILIYDKYLRRLFYLGSLLQNETMELFSFGKRRKSKHKFGRKKFCKAEEVIKYPVNSKIENEVFG